jgi:hypothetical protein
LQQFQVAPGAGWQVDEFARALHSHPVDVCERAALGVLGVGQQRAGGGLRLHQVLRLPGRKAGGLQMFQQLALAQTGVKLPVGPHRDRHRASHGQRAQPGLEGGRGTGAEEQLTRRNAAHPVGQFVGRALGQVHLALGDAQPGQPAAVARALVHRQQHRLGLVAQQFQVGQCARGHHTHHLAFHRTFGGGHVAHLLTNGHRFPQLDEPRQVGIDRMKRYARHHHRRTSRLATLRQRDVKQARGFFCIGKKQLVEIAHAIKQQGVGVVCFQAQVLGHHGGVLFCVSHRLESSNFNCTTSPGSPRKTHMAALSDAKSATGLATMRSDSLTLFRSHHAD